ncbi:MULTISPECIES: branched-chain amino acid ABC transporter permease [Lactobacillus]|uniref:Branched-chain amino acid ABC superfamily ATP binding cassette transporter, permease protein n=1 Tax=Lactobacillus kullabergensis TaxID=1218493 RepID=A0A0F4LKF0_9LACO|nr:MULTISPECIES: branched-chain amino acid ABC transporter permease [Lactobacillus]MCT6807092.1 branched-chain amino acid ABC transporter permease [Bombilactobacillus sp.]AWM74672.1 branched-chain amino acid ABC transporter permease [Lactobacillus kullabergensis]KGG54516.1 High-affinity branched-chain amino acid transport system permease protein LivH [Lactobacillus sp. wkB10]KJY59055.1 Branched-chain amino acid ABC superfamily ATP binding cassette transporter, permease protein [Lactobacillus ku
MQTVLQQIINALSLGSIYALLALGYSMVYGIINLINFAHGDIYMLGAFFAYYVINAWHFNFITALLSAMIIGAVSGVVIEYFAYRPLRKSPRIAVLITAIGVSFLLENGMSYFVGSNARSFPQVIEQVNYNIGGVQISNVQILILATALILMVSLQVIIQKTKMGRAMRAVSVDPAAAELVGVNVNHTISFTFALGSALAGAAGILIGMYYNQIDPLMGMTPGIKAFVAAVLGGIGSVPGASIGGFLIGILETFFQSIGLSAYKDSVVYLVLIVILLFLPAGIFGKNAKEKV